MANDKDMDGEALAVTKRHWVEFEKWWKDHGQFIRAGGGTYEKTFAWKAWNWAIYQNNQQGAVDVVEGFKLIPVPPYGFDHRAYNQYTGEWAYLNHANTWQLFQGPIEQPHSQQSADIDGFVSYLRERYRMDVSEQRDEYLNLSDHCPNHENE